MDCLRGKAKRSGNSEAKITRLTEMAICNFNEVEREHESEGQRHRPEVSAPRTLPALVTPGMSAVNFLGGSRFSRRQRFASGSAPRWLCLLRLACFVCEAPGKLLLEHVKLQPPISWYSHVLWSRRTFAPVRSAVAGLRPFTM
jgi:hypothetical protein